MLKRKSKRVLSIVLAVAMIVGLFPIAAFADNGTTTVSDETGLKEALTANTTSTIVLGQDITVDEQLTVNGSHVLDLGSHTLTSQVNQHAILVKSNANLTVQNGTLVLDTETSDIAAINSESESTVTLAANATINSDKAGILCGNDKSKADSNATLNVYGKIDCNDVGVWSYGGQNTITIDGATIDSCYFGVYQNGSAGGSTITIKNSTISDTYDTQTETGCGVYIANSNDKPVQTLIIENSIISGVSGVEVKNTNVTISGDQAKITATGSQYVTSPTITPNGNGSTGVGYSFILSHNGSDVSNGEVSGQVNIVDGIFSGPIDIEGRTEEKTPDNIVITGGTFVGDANNTAVNFVAPGNTVDANGQVVVNSATAFAEVNGVGYTSLQGAIDGVVDDTQTTVILLKNTSENVTIPEDKKIALDLNGFTLDGQTTSNKAALTNNGTVIIKDSSTAKTGTIKRSDISGQSSYYTILNNKTMTIESGNIQNNAGSETTWSGSSLICNGPSSEATLTINGGNIQQDNFIAVKNDEKGTLFVNGGTIKSKTQAVQNWKKADITGGDLTGDVKTWAYSDIAGTTNISDNVVINGNVGAYWYGKGSDYPVQDGCTPTVNIEGGTVLGSLEKRSIKTTGNAAATPVEPTDTTGDINVSGGRFAKPVNVAFVADDIKAQLKSADDSEAPYSYYTSVDAALAAAQPGDEVVDLSATSTTTKYTVTIKYNNGDKDLTLTVPKNKKLTLPAAPSRADYTFDGWIINGERYAAGAKITITADTEISADWQPPYTGKFSYEIFTTVGDNGAIDVDRYATEGDKVTITVSPDEAYMLDEMTVTSGGKDVEVTDNGDGTYTFTMPSGDVKIEVTFAEDPDWEEEPAMPFVDVDENDWFYDVVLYAYENGLMTGTSADTFAPNTATTRGMIVSMLARLEGVTSAESAGFTDVAESDWYATAVNWAASEGIVNGFEDDTFRPNAPITREQMAAILYNYADYKGYDVSARADLSDYADAASISSWAEDVLAWANAEGLINGMTATTIDPQGETTRAQTAAMFERFLTAHEA